ncbi:hypothetical protein [Streptomyces sp. CA-111067]|uniref:hypothetical protein n=1 Tax=Streptomyces sp. CA-111067 TaxID=3240046 RepID=UPI003D96EEF7
MPTEPGETAPAAPAPVHTPTTGTVWATVHLPGGLPLGYCDISPRGLTPVEIRSIAYRTSRWGTIRMGLFPATYILVARAEDAAGRRLYGESPEFVIELGRTVTTRIDLAPR